MTSAASSHPGETRNCPHCKETILKSATICPACRHHIQFEAVRAGAPPGICPLRIEGTLRHPGTEGECEYSVILEVSNDRGEAVLRRVMSVGTFHPAETRTFSVRVEFFSHDKPAT
jgi:hypothetical protein